MTASLFGDLNRVRKALASTRPALKFATIIVPVALIVAAAMLLGLLRPPPEGKSDYPVPSQSDWVDCGAIFWAGEEGEWDRYLWGGFANTVVKKDGLFHLYYQGARAYDERHGTVVDRAIGVATSSDGFVFSKYEQNPILTWFPNENLEEGAVSGGAFLDDEGNVNIFYGANSWVGGRRVTADGRFAISSDGFTFVDKGVVLDHGDILHWGWGDELFPIIAFRHGDSYFTYYIPNGSLQRGWLGVAWGPDPLRLRRSSPARAGSRRIPVWGPGSFIQVDTGVYALFLNNLYAAGGHTLEVRTVSTEEPDELSAPLEVYKFENARQASVILDQENGRWLMFYRSVEHDYYGVMTAALPGGSAGCDVE